MGFFDHYDPSDTDSETEEDKGKRNCSEILGFIGYTFLILLIVLNLDFLLSTYSASPGLVNWNSHKLSHAAVHKVSGVL